MREWARIFARSPQARSPRPPASPLPPKDQQISRYFTLFLLQLLPSKEAILAYQVLQTNLELYP